MVERILEGQSVVLRPLDAADTEALFQAGQDAEIWAYMSRRVSTLPEMKLLVEDALSARDSGREYPFVIVEKSSGQVIGSTRFLDISLPNRHLEVGWTWLSSRVWRTRINTECKYLLLKHAFEELHTVRVQLKTDGRNIRSQQAIERLGAVKEGVLRKHMMMPDGYIRDSVYYSIIDSEWPSVRVRLEHFLSQS